MLNRDESLEKVGDYYVNYHEFFTAPFLDSDSFKKWLFSQSEQVRNVLQGFNTFLYYVPTDGVNSARDEYKKAILESLSRDPDTPESTKDERLKDTLMMEASFEGHPEREEKLKKLTKEEYEPYLSAHGLHLTIAEYILINMQTFDAAMKSWYEAQGLSNRYQNRHFLNLHFKDENLHFSDDIIQEIAELDSDMRPRDYQAELKAIFERDGQTFNLEESLTPPEEEGIQLQEETTHVVHIPTNDVSDDVQYNDAPPYQEELITTKPEQAHLSQPNIQDHELPVADNQAKKIATQQLPPDREHLKNFVEGMAKSLHAPLKELEKNKKVNEQAITILFDLFRNLVNFNPDPSNRDYKDQIREEFIIAVDKYLQYKDTMPKKASRLVFDSLLKNMTDLVLSEESITRMDVNLLYPRNPLKKELLDRLKECLIQRLGKPDEKTLRLVQLITLIRNYSLSDPQVIEGIKQKLLELKEIPAKKFQFFSKKEAMIPVQYCLDLLEFHYESDSEAPHPQ